jgi:hypothetical protein
MGWRSQLVVIRFGSTNYSEFGRVVKGQHLNKLRAPVGKPALEIWYLTFEIWYGIMSLEQLNIPLTLLSREAEGPAL